MQSELPPQGPVAAMAVSIAATAYDRMWRLIRRFRRSRLNGVRGIPVTRDRRLVLVRHTYLPGWHFPGGGYQPGEDSEAAMLRELREEIGMTTHGLVEQFGTYRHRGHARDAHVTLFVVQDVDYAPMRSFEIADIHAFAPDALPDDLTPATRRRDEEWRAALPRDPVW
jgi:ADP-ribose pyrophosphatase YjhB (NUDIX family)